MGAGKEMVGIKCKKRLVPLFAPCEITFSYLI